MKKSVQEAKVGANAGKAMPFDDDFYARMYRKKYPRARNQFSSLTNSNLRRTMVNPVRTQTQEKREKLATEKRQKLAVSSLVMLTSSYVTLNM